MPYSPDSTIETLLNFETVGFNDTFKRCCRVGWLAYKPGYQLCQITSNSAWFDWGGFSLLVSTPALDNSITVLLLPICSSLSALGLFERLCVKKLER
jgi:hypothetical protein